MAKPARKVVRYIPSVTKALEVILWLADRQASIDVYRVVKAAFYADKYHVAKFGRPIIGDVYRAAWFGPLPQVIYGLLRHQPIEVLALGLNGPLPFKVDETTFRIHTDRGPNKRRLSASDVEALTYGLKEIADASFDDLVAQTHREPAYEKAVGSSMDYRDFVPENDPDRQAKIEYLEEVAPFAAL